MIKILNDLLFFYSASLTLTYVLLAILSAMILTLYYKKNKFISYETLLISDYTPSVSLIAPAYNEEKSIVANIRSLLSMHYNDLEVIIVNDGSKDQTMETMIEAYSLQKVDFSIHYQIPCKNIKGIYKSINPTYNKLLVIDKENGGKSDALNAGINISSKELICCIDVDCVIDQEGLLKMVKPFLEDETKVIACGGTIRIANSCIIEDGKLIEARVPEAIIARFQVLEYLRAFLIGRMAWSKINGLILISGAMGMFDKRIVIDCGGYNHDTVGEDMELVVRMRRYMHDQKKPCKVAYIPDPVCWTEAPSSYEILSRQRNRWARGTIETLWSHRKLFFNPKYTTVGLISYPYWFFFEWLAPIVEGLGLLYFIILVVTGNVNFYVFMYLTLAVFSFAFMISAFAILFEEMTYRQYKKLGSALKLLGTAILEPILYHPRSAYWAIRGNIDKIRGVKKWGEMTRTGFTKKETK